MSRKIIAIWLKGRVRLTDQAQQLELRLTVEKIKRIQQ